MDREEMPVLSVNSLARYGLVAAVAWTFLIAYSLYWDHRQHREETLLLGKMQAQAFFEKDILYRRWAARHGGVYVPVSDSTQPNPYLDHVAERDIATPSDRKLTLINPAYMTRQVFEMAQEYKGTGRGHITSLKPIRPQNAPDAWERKALVAFEAGAAEVGQIEQVAGQPYYRYMRPLKADKPCLKCHESQGYREGDVRGGLSVSVPLAPVYDLMAAEMRGAYLNHGVIWLLGVGLIVGGTRRLSGVTSRLLEKTNALEQEVAERRATQQELEEQAVVLEEEVTERRRAEDAVRASEEKFAKAFRSAPIMLTISRLTDGTYLDVNEQFCELSGFGRDEAIGRSSIDLGWITAEDRARLVGELNVNRRVCGLELQLHPKNGRALTCLCYGESITVEGEPCLLALLYNVTEHRIMEQQLRQSQKMEAIGQLAGGVAHDFNNILTVIMGYANMLVMDPDLAAEHREQTEQILASADKAAQLTFGLLAFSRKESPDLKRVDLNEIVQHVQKFLKRVIGEDVQLETRCSTAPAPVMADTAQIEQLLINLATNARDAMPTGGMLRIETGIVDIDETFVQAHGQGSPGSHVCLTVSDTGNGMDELTRTRIFEPFFTTKEVGKGTGLGMAIVYGVVKQHGGFINVYSELGIGSTFRIYLPASASMPLLEVAPALPAVPQGGDETILVVEDDDNLRTLVENILTNYGYCVITAADGQEAVETFALRRGEIQLVVMDMIMPRKNGQEALEEIRQLQPEVKAVYVSGYPADFMKSRGVDEAQVELVMKPVKPLELLRIVRRVLDGGTAGCPGGSAAPDLRSGTAAAPLTV